MPKRINPDWTLDLEINGKKVLILLGDDRNIYEGHRERIARSHIAFKRMLKQSDLIGIDNIRPFGLNYAPYHHNGYFMIKAVKSLDKNYLARAIAHNRYAAPFFGRKETVANIRIDSFESSLQEKQNLAVFFCRLWDPKDVIDTRHYEERERINEERVQMLMTLRKHFHKYFIGGIREDPFSKKLPREFLAPVTATLKKNYLRTIKKASVGIATPGIYNSIGWKFTEYVISPMAVVTNNIKEIALPGKFQENSHYLNYDRLEDCLSQVDRHLSNSELRRTQMLNNRRYYEEFIHPESLMRRIIKESIK